MLHIFSHRLTGNASEIVIGLRKSRSLLEVKLGGNPWTPDDINEIISIFRKRCFLKNISFGEYKWLTKDQTNVYITICLTYHWVKLFSIFI